MNREDALSLLKEHMKESSLLLHSLETEAVMRRLARHFGEDEDLWGVVGLLHDIDYERTKDNPQLHGRVAVEEILKDKLPEDALHAIVAHNSEYTKVEPSSTLDIALRCAETITGLIRANALVRPTGMKGMKPKSLKKKMKDKSFAANVSRERIMECEKIGLSFAEFAQKAIEAMQDLEEK